MLHSRKGLHPHRKYQNLLARTDVLTHAVGEWLKVPQDLAIFSALPALRMVQPDDDLGI